MSRKTEFASSWWAQRWIRLLERFGWSARLNRGRAYARHGNVLDIDVQSGLVRAKVQGSRKAPYRVEIGLKPLSRSDWDRVFTLLRKKAIYAARLLSGEMPRDIEEIFKAAEVPLFPRSGEDLVMSCTCPDWASPCKHVAAVYYVLGSEFDRDPFLLFELRGKSKEQVMAALRGGGRRQERLPGSRAPRISSEPLEDHLTDFWQAGEELDDITIRVIPPPVPQAILKRLGPLPLRDLPEEWYGDLTRMYEVVGRDALAFVNVSGVARPPRMSPMVNANGNNGHDDDLAPDDPSEAVHVMGDDEGEEGTGTELASDMLTSADDVAETGIPQVTGMPVETLRDDSPARDPVRESRETHAAAPSEIKPVVDVQVEPETGPPHVVADSEDMTESTPPTVPDAVAPSTEPENLPPLALDTTSVELQAPAPRSRAPRRRKPQPNTVDVQPTGADVQPADGQSLNAAQPDVEEAPVLRAPQRSTRSRKAVVPPEELPPEESPVQRAPRTSTRSRKPAAPVDEPAAEASSTTTQAVLPLDAE